MPDSRRHSKRGRARPEEDTNTAQEGPPVLTGSKFPYLLIISGSRVGELHKLTQVRTLVGRSLQAHLPIFDEGVSRQHVELVVEGDVVTAVDLGSTNGTYCNGTRIDTQRLTDGDKISIGSTTILKFSYQDGVDVAYQLELYKSVLRDGLTKALKREHFLERLQEEVAFALRHGSPLALIYWDFDRFKAINDVHGHQAGDHVLATAASTVQALLRREDVFARCGGEEFAASCRSTPLEHALTLAERLRKGIEQMKVETAEGTLCVTASFGVAICPGEGIVHVASLMAAADRAMYSAKARGRNRVEIAGRHL